MNTIGQRLEWAMDQRNIKAPKLAPLAEMTPQAIYQIVNGVTKNPQPDNLLNLCKALDISFEWLITGEGVMENSSKTEGLFSDMVDIESYSAKAGASATGYVNYFPAETESRFSIVRSDILNKGLAPNMLCIITAEGKSMEPDINDGDRIIVNLEGGDLISGEIYVIRWVDELRVKKISKDVDGSLIIRSSNPDKSKYPDERIDPHADGFDIIGKVEWRGGWLSAN